MLRQEQNVFLRDTFTFKYVPAISERSPQKLLLPITYIDIKEYSKLLEGNKPKFTKTKETTWHVPIFLDALRQEPIKLFIGIQLDLEGVIRLKVSNSTVMHGIFTLSNSKMIDKLFQQIRNK